MNESSHELLRLASAPEAVEPSGEALRRAHDDLKAILAALPDLLFDVDGSGCIHGYYAPEPELLYAKPRSFLGKRFADILPREVAACIQGAIDEAAREGRHTGATYCLQVPKGPQWFELSIAAKGDRRAPEARFIVLIRNISARREAQDALAASEAKYRRLHESMADAYVGVDMQGRITETNPAYCDMLGYTDAELRRLTYTDLTPQAWHAFEARIVATQILTGGYSGIYEKEYRRKDGTVFPVELRTFLLRDSGGNPAGMWAIVRDITLRKQSEEALRRSRDELERRVAERTAQLRTLTAQMIDVEDREREQIGHTLHDDLQQILVALQYKIAAIAQEAPSSREKALPAEAQGILDRAILLTRSLSRQFLPPPLRGRDLAEDLTWVTADMRDSFNLKARLRVAPALPAVPDEIRIFLIRAVRELLFNVVRHAGVKAAEVALMPCEGGGIAVTVRDKGGGFDGGNVGKNGLGLRKLRERAMFLGGEIAVDSAPGKGTRVELRLPCN